jgi:hypothetical protein
MNTKIDPKLTRKKEVPNLFKDFYKHLDGISAGLQLHLTNSALYITPGPVFDLSLSSLARSLNQFLLSRPGRYERQQVKIRKLKGCFIIERVVR